MNKSVRSGLNAPVYKGMRGCAKYRLFDNGTYLFRSIIGVNLFYVK